MSGDIHRYLNQRKKEMEEYASMKRLLIKYQKKTQELNEQLTEALYNNELLKQKNDDLDKRYLEDKKKWVKYESKIASLECMLEVYDKNLKLERKKIFDLMKTIDYYKMEYDDEIRNSHFPIDDELMKLL